MQVFNRNLQSMLNGMFNADCTEALQADRGLCRAQGRSYHAFHSCSKHAGKHPSLLHFLATVQAVCKPAWTGQPVLQMAAVSSSVFVVCNWAQMGDLTTANHYYVLLVVQRWQVTCAGCCSWHGIQRSRLCPCIACCVVSCDSSL